MANQNGRTHHRDEHIASYTPNVEHGYQDPRDQRDREQGRDDFRGLDSDRHGDRYAGGNGGWSQGDQYAERDRNTGYGYNDGSIGRDDMTYRGGQSGSQSGERYGANPPWQGQGVRGGSEGRWGDMDQGGRSQPPQQQQRGPHSGKGPQGFQRSDERLKEMVHETLTDHGEVDATHIIVDVKNGEVTLTGTVEDRRTKRLAEDAVETVTG
ncbi:MAG: BON domain-containing protein, partial [Kofleriaceae bacterium]